MSRIKLNSTIILLIILIVLTGGYLGWQYFKGKADEKVEELIFGNFDTTQITKIEVSHQQANVENLAIIDLKDNQWLVTSQNSLPADQTIIANILTTLPQVKIQALVSANPLKQPEYLVDSSGSHVKIYRGEKAIFDFYAGKNGPVFSTGYFRWENSNQVYLISENLQVLFGQSDWSDKKVVAIDKTLVTKISWQYPSSSFDLEKVDNKWQINNQEANNEKVDTLLNSLANLTAQEVAWAKNDLAPAQGLILTLEAGNLTKLFINKNKDNYLIRKEGDNREFTIGSYLYEQIAKRVSEFK